MMPDFHKTSLDYNWGFIDGILWVTENRNKIEFNDMMEMVEDILKTNDDIMNEYENRFKPL